jgi:hypothetical protein
MATCEFCNTTNDVRYINFNISILGADVCTSCERVTRTKEFRTGIITLLNGKGKKVDIDSLFHKRRKTL